VARRNPLAAAVKAEARLRVKAARDEIAWPAAGTGTPLADKVAVLLRLERGSEIAYRFTDQVLAARELYRRRAPSTGGRRALAYPWPVLIELAWVIFRDCGRPATSHRDGTFVEFLRVVYGVVPPKAEIQSFLRRIRAR